MKETLKKYSFIIVFLVIIFSIEYYFSPKQFEFYTRQDIDKLKDSNFYLTILLEIFFLGILF
ncbi:MAG: hypothetical protein K0U54_02555, partial [Bacteroidetes bacterium]|nr:hypothetical protein [Bacteroidota bacterium]